MGGGRSFTFTGGHLHESFAEEGYRKFLVNGILWSANLKIPADGAPVKLTEEDNEQVFAKRTCAEREIDRCVSANDGYIRFDRC